jgi:hypothetical protein
MSNNVFTEFLNRQKPTLIVQFSKHLSEIFPTFEPDRIQGMTPRVVDFFLGRILATLNLEDDLSQKVIANALDTQLSPEIMEKNINKFFAILEVQRRSDPQLNETQRTSVEKMLNQSHKFLLTNIFLVKMKNLKPENMPPKED